MLIGAGVVIVLVVVGVVLGVVLGGGSSSDRRGSLADALPGAATVQRLFAGIPQRGNVLGSPSAPVTMVEYIDLQCPYCQAFESRAMPTLVSRYVRTGKLKVEVRLLAFIGPDSVRGRAAAIAAGQQNRLFNFAELLYLNQGAENSGWLSDDEVTSAAASIPGLDVTRLLTARSSSGVADEASRFDEQAAADGVSQTPTILVGTSAGAAREVTLTSPDDPAPVIAAVEASGA